MNDILPKDVATWQFVEKTAQSIFNAFGFNEIRVPVVEKTELFSRSIGEATDIVEKEMYTFSDRSDNSLTLRPEGTAPVMRSLIQHKLINQDPVQKLYYSGPMFRYERPQKGRYRQFHQIGAEVVGIDDPLIDAQVLVMLDHFFKEVGITDVTLEINSLGCPECRPGYREALTAFLEQRLEALCSDCQRRFQQNPLRALDCKVPGCKEATVGAPVVLDHLCSGCDDHFSQVRNRLQDVNVAFNINPRMVRGLDYYTKTTFEMITGSLGAQNAVAAGGRYDGLVQKLGGPKVPGIGFAMGVERLVLLLSELELTNDQPDLFIAALGKEAQQIGFKLLTDLQRNGLRAEMDYSGRGLKSQMKRADKLGARYSLIIGDDELTKGVAPLRNMSDGEQTDVDFCNTDLILSSVKPADTP
jgi:histidyl-tRNA synthetase